MAMETEDRKLHIAMFPWLAFGHIIPYLQLAKLIARKGHQISFISTQRNIDRLPKLSPDLSQLIHFVKLPLPSLPNLPDGAEATSDLPLDQGPVLKEAYDLLRDAVDQLFRRSNPDWVLCDFAADWMPEMCRGIGLRSVYFSIFTAASLSYGGSEIPDPRTAPEDFCVPPKWIPFPSTVAFRKFEVMAFYDALVNDSRSVFTRTATLVRGCDVVAVRSCWELEGDHLHLLKDLHRKPVLPVGQLPPDDDQETDDTWNSSPFKEWLDNQENGSVVYVAFGSESEWSRDQLAAIALGLELSGLPFFWVLKTPFGSGELPEGFENRVKGSGYVCRSWAPQVKILSHDSIGAFLSHGGWSSVVEGLRFSRPLVLLAFGNDQGLNVKNLEEKMLGYPVPRDENDGSFTKESVAEALTLVVKEEEGRVYRERAKELSDIFGNKEVQDKYVNQFLDNLKTHTNRGTEI